MILSLLKKINYSILTNKKFTLVALLLIFLSSFTVSAQSVVNYQCFQTTTGSTFPLPGKTLLSPTSGTIDDVFYNFNLPFDFNFGGVNYTTASSAKIYVSTNGFATLGTAPTAVNNYAPLSTTDTYSGAISVYGTDLDLAPATGVRNIGYVLSGSSPSRILKIEWVIERSSGANSSIDGGNPIVMQLWLHETTNVIEMHYNTYNPANTVRQGQIGLRGSTTADYVNLNYSATANWPVSPSTMPLGTANNQTVVTRGTSGQILSTSNRLFRWTPVTCFAPSVLTLSAITFNSATLSWTAASPAPSLGYDYYVVPSTNIIANALIPGTRYQILTLGSTNYTLYGAASNAIGTFFTATGTGGGTGTVSVVPANPTALTTPTGTVGAGVLTTPVTGLSSATTYYAYVRSKCSASDTSSWSLVKSFSTLCAPTTPNYFMYFDEADGSFPYTVPAIPGCHSIQNVGVGPLNVWKTSYNTPASDTGGFFDEHLVYDATTGTGGTDDANVWFFTTGLNLVAGTTYKLNYDYGGSTENPTITNKMLVKYGTAPSDAGMTAGTLLADHDNIKASPITNYVSFTPTVSGVYYIGFKAYSAKNNGRLFLDIIELTAPGCVNPTAVSTSSITGSSATVTWTAPAPAPAGGYAYYLTTNPNIAATAMVAGTQYQIKVTGSTNFTLYGAASNVPGTIFTCTATGAGTGVVASTAIPAGPSYSQTPTGFLSAGSTVLNLSGLTGSTTYYVWVRSKCNPFASDYSEWTAMQSFTTLFQPIYCTPATASTTSYFSNFATTGGIANISNPTAFSAGGYGNYISQIVSQSAGATVNFNTGIVGPTVGVAIYIDWDNDGTFAFVERVFNTAAYVTTCSGSFTVPGGQAIGDYRMRIVLDYLATSPVACSFSGAGEAEDYTFRVVTPPPALALNITSSTQCASVDSPLVQITPATFGNYDSYSVSPSIGYTGTASTGYTFNSNTTITYTIKGTQTYAPYATRSVTFTYTANPLPTPITITPTAATVCQTGPATLISAAGGVVSGVAILSENFNSGAPGWTAVNGSTGGAAAAAAWTIRPSGYNPGGSSGITSVVSNDSSQFYISNSDAQGSGSNTLVTLESPTFSISSLYTNVSLSFFHYYKPWINGSATVEIYNGSSWVTLQSWGTSATTTAQGTATGFANPIYNLNSYIGLSGLKVRFTYQASWGFVWAIDNFLVSGSASSAITWNTQTAPVANGVAVPGLYTNLAATLPYLAGTGTNTVYVLPSATTTFTASASTPAPVCSSTSSIVITVTPVVGGTASSDQTVCSGLAANLTLAGYTGTIVRWESSYSPAFTTPTAIPASNFPTLTSAQMGAITTDRYFRAVVTNGSCAVPAYSNIVKITYNYSLWDGVSWDNGIPNATKTAIFDGDYSSSNLISPGDLNACSVIISSGDISFLSGHSLISQNEVTNSGGTLTFENNASLVQVNNNAVNSGNITYKRNTTPMRKFDFTYWSSPVAPQTLVGLSPSTLYDKYFYFDPSNVYGWIAAPGNTLMNPGKGYIIRAPQGFDPVTPAVFNGEFFGTPNNGVISTPILVSTYDINLIGNPYPSALNINAFFDYNGITTGTGIVDKTIYLWTHNTAVAANNYTNSDYAVYNYMGGIGTTGAPGANNAVPNGNVASGQSFFIKGLANGNAVFNNSMRVTGNNNQFYKSAASNAVASTKDRVWLELFNGQGAYKQILVGYAPEATNQFDSGYDGEYVDGGTGLSFYSILSPKKLAIQGRGLPFVETDVIPLGYKNNVAGTYEIKLSNFEGVFDTQKVYLEDKLLNVIHNLKVSSYSFATNTGTFDNRFELRFTDSSLATNNQVFTDESVVVYKENQSIHINASNTTLAEVTIYDIRGALLYSKNNVNSNELIVSNLASSQQVLLVNIKSFEGKTVTKKIIF